MGAKTGISWTNSTWNPIRGCSMAPGSELGGCLNCYAARMHTRNLPGLLSPITGKPFAILRDTGPRWTGEVELIKKMLDLPLRWKRPRMIFVNSQSDLWHPALSMRDKAKVYAVMALCQAQNRGHIFQVLTKRPEERLEAFTRFQVEFWEMVEQEMAWLCVNNKWCMPDVPEFPLKNVWEGTSIENQATANARVLPLQKTPAAIRFLSYEPALGPVNLNGLRLTTDIYNRSVSYSALNFEEGASYHAQSSCAQLSDRKRIDWVIVGGESGPGARPSHPQWYRDIRDQCKAAEVPYFFKQWGEFTPRGPESMGYPLVEGVPTVKLNADGSDGYDIANNCANTVFMQKSGKHRPGNNLLDGQLYEEFPA